MFASRIEGLKSLVNLAPPPHVPILSCVVRFEVEPTSEMDWQNQLVRQEEWGRNCSRKNFDCKARSGKNSLGKYNKKMIDSTVA